MITAVTSTVSHDDPPSLDIDHVADVRQKVPVLQQQRTDLYELKDISS